MVAVMMLMGINTASGVTRYASPKGSDPSGKRIEKPGELRAMVEKLAPGDTLLLLDGQYDLVNTVVVNVKAAPDKWVVIGAANGAQPILDFREQTNGNNGMKVTGWMVQNLESWKVAKAAGCDSTTSDYPMALLKAIKADSAK
jgi:hypothetical protein